MTVRVERGFEVPAARERVWEFIADPAARARAISVVAEYEVDGDRGTWHVRLPVPLVDRTVSVRTRDEKRREPEYVRFTGRSKAMRVMGEHELDAVEDGTRLTNRFVVDGGLPGVERFFRRNLDGEIENLREALLADVGVSP